MYVHAYAKFKIIAHDIVESDIIYVQDWCTGVLAFLSTFKIETIITLIYIRNNQLFRKDHKIKTS